VEDGTDQAAHAGRPPPRPRPRRGSGRSHRSWLQRLVLLGGCLSTLGLGMSAAGLAYIFRKYERLPRVELGGALFESTGSGGVENYLIVGVDSASRLDPDDPVRIGRSGELKTDTIMILRIDPGTKDAKLLSLPRDLWVPLAGTGYSRKINAAVEVGGPQMLVRTIAENFRIEANHYVEVDFAAFRELVDAIDGVDVYIPFPARDKETGLDQRRAGCVTLDPVQALAYVRSRHYEQLIDGDWELDPSADFGRIDRQQDFIVRALRKAVDRGSRNPGTIDELIDVGLEGITVDDDLTADDIFSLGREFRSFDPETLKTYSVEATPDTAGDASIVRLVEDKAEPIFALFRDAPADVASGDIAPESVRLQVLNGSGAAGEGSAAAEALRAAGFRVSATGNSPTLDYERTVVQYPPERAAQADLVSRWLVSGADLEPVAGSAGLVLVTGADWQGVRDEARPASSTSASAPGGAGDSRTTTSSAPDAGAAGASSSTTAPAAARDC
jgi:polyisoprenyl-teichoic acid--peptidoglycan teichoic acid transferase